MRVKNETFFSVFIFKNTTAHVQFLSKIAVRILPCQCLKKYRIQLMTQTGRRKRKRQTAVECQCLNIQGRSRGCRLFFPWFSRWENLCTNPYLSGKNGKIGKNAMLISHKRFPIGSLCKRVGNPSRPINPRPHQQLLLLQNAKFLLFLK